MSNRQVQEEFVSQFGPEVKEKLFLVRRKAGKGTRKDAWMLTGTSYLASVDCGSGEFREGRGTLRWMYKPGLFGGTKDFEPMGIYRVQVRESMRNPADYMVVRILGKTQDARLEAFRAEYEKPVSVVNSLGTFVLNREYDWYEGEIDYLNKWGRVTVAVEDGTTEAGPQFLRLGQICADLAGYDARVRQYVAAEEFLWDWLEDAGVSHEGFEQQLDTPLISVNPDCSVDFWFDGGEPFGWHSIIVSLDADDSCTGIDLAG